MSQKKKKNTQMHEILQFFFILTKRIRKKNKLIKNKVQIENTDIRIIK